MQHNSADVQNNVIRYEFKINNSEIMRLTSNWPDATYLFRHGIYLKQKK